MSRLQKKCVIASTGLHLLLALVLLVGPAFLSSSSKQNTPPIINFIPVRSVEGEVTGGGHPDAPLAQPAPPPPRPVQTPAPVPPPPQQPREVAPQPRTETPTVTVNQRHTVVPNLTPTVRNPNQTSTSRPRPQASDDASQRRIADQINQAAQSIHSGLSASTSIELHRGPGGGGEPYAGFNQTVLGIYDQAWIAPEGMEQSEAVVAVRVTIESDGRVSDARIIERSGDARVDRSVQEALDRVTSIPVPEGSRSSRTVEFTFKSRNKQNI